VVNVSVCNEDRVQRAWLERRFLPVSFSQFLKTLENSAVNEHARVLGLDKILGSGNRADAAPKR
jgi:hypothetical protein